MDAAQVVEALVSLQISVRAEGDKLLLIPGSKVPQELVQEVRKHKGEIIGVLNRGTELTDLPFPIGYGGLPRAQVEMAEAVMDDWGVTDPILRKYNVLSWVRGYYQDVGENHGEHYEILKGEQARLGDILDSQSKKYS
jgi:hypothetical protein